MTAYYAVKCGEMPVAIVSSERFEQGVLSGMGVER